MKLSIPKILLHLEGLVVLASAIFLQAGLGSGWKWFSLTFLLPDVALFGYLAGPRVGAACYNAFHTYTAPLLLGMAILASGNSGMLWIALVWTAHIGFDRLLGFGLKYESAARDTHLSRV